MHMAIKERRPTWMSCCDEKILFDLKTDGLVVDDKIFLKDQRVFKTR